MHLPMWIDSHCHLDAAEFDADREAVAARARAAGVALAVLPAVEATAFERVRAWAWHCGWGYALGIHPLFVDRAGPDDLQRLRAALRRWAGDPHLVAVGEIGLDHFVAGLDRARQEAFFSAQLKLAHEFGLPVLLHVRRAVDGVLKGVRRHPGVTGIAHAFNGSVQQAGAFTAAGFKLGFGGALTFERARRLRHLAQTVDAEALVLETDAPDIAPQWLHCPAAQRNEPAELPRIAETLAALRGWPLAQVAATTCANTLAALPRLAPLLARAAP